MKFSFVIVASLVARISASTIAATTASTMKLALDDLAEARTQFTKINEVLTKFPQNGMEGVNLIQDHGAKLRDAFDSLITNINNLPRPVSTANAKKIIDTYTSITPVDISSSNQFAAKSADFVAISSSVASSMQANLVVSNAVCTSLAQGVEAISPPDMVSSVAATFAAADAARTLAINAFPSS